MEFYDEIQNWGDWSKKKNRSGRDGKLKYLCQSKREVSNIQILLQGIKHQLTISNEKVNNEILGQCYQFQTGIYNYISNFVKIIEGLNKENNNKQFYNDLKSIDWSKISLQLDLIININKQLPLGIKERIKILMTLLDKMQCLSLSISNKVKNNRLNGKLSQDDFKEIFLNRDEFLYREIKDFIVKNSSNNLDKDNCGKGVSLLWK